MSKQLNFEYKGVQYCLEYTRSTVKNLENMGFNPQDISEKMMTRLPQLFEGAFMAHHSRVKPGLIKEIYKNMPDKMELFRCLRDMFNDPYDELLADPDGESGNVVSWTANWKREDDE